MKRLISIRPHLFAAIAGLLLCLSYHPSFAQTDKEKLQKEYQTLLNEIKTIESTIKETAKKKLESLNQLQSLDAKINTRSAMISNLREQIGDLNAKVEENQTVIAAMEKDIAKLKEDYGQMLYYAYKGLNSKESMVFLFSSKTFNEAISRFNYIRRYGQYRQKQAEAISRTVAQLNDKQQKLAEMKSEKEALLKEQESQQNNLISEKSSKGKLVDKLKQDEANLSKQAKVKNDAARRLDKQIQTIILEEIRLAKEKAKLKNKDTQLKMTPEEQQLADNFVSNKSKLPWPVERGFVVEKFGRHEHPDLKGVVIENNGVNIQTVANATVRAIFEGSVVSVFYSPGNQHSIIVKHGDYFTVYSNVIETQVKPGDRVKTKQSLGKAHTSSTDKQTMVHFEIWQSTNKLNPELWLARAS